jgi:hypothetical protein
MAVAINLPTLRPAPLPGVFVEAAELAGAPILAATIRPDIVGSIRRRFFQSERETLAWAAGHADQLEVGLFDLTGGSPE